jgi:hypothetical protein
MGFFRMKSNSNGQFYFPLFRAMALLVGGNHRRSESNGIEALMVCFAIYMIHYMFFATEFISPDLKLWLAVLLLFALGFGVWIFWLLLVYFNSLIIKGLQLCGLFRTVPVRRIQSVLWMAWTTVMAWTLLNGNQFLHEIAAIWLVAVAMNLAAAVYLALSNATRDSGE